jgi:hypothetical protein
MAGFDDDRSGCSPAVRRPVQVCSVECPAGHAMEMLSFGCSWRCDVCKTSGHEKFAPRLNCRRCNYDMCKTCIPRLQREQEERKRRALEVGQRRREERERRETEQRASVCACVTAL